MTLAEWISTILNGIILIATICALGYAHRTLKLARKQAEDSTKAMEAQVNAIKTLETSIVRPRMSAYLKPPHHEKAWLKLGIINKGLSAAKDVQISFDPPLPEPDLKHLQANSSDTQTYHKAPLATIKEKFENKTFTTWTPGLEMTPNFWVLKFTHYPRVETQAGGTTRDSYDKDMLLDESAEKIPAGTTVIISYKDHDGNSYTEHFDLDPSIWIGHTFEDNRP